LNVEYRRWLIAVRETMRGSGRALGPLLTRQAALAGMVVGVALLSGCFSYQDYPQTAIEPITEYGRKQQTLFEIIVWLAIFVFVVVEGVLLYTVWRYRARPGQPRPQQIHGNTKLEVAWTIAPAVVLAAIAVPTVTTIFDIGGPPPADAMRIQVIGHQWWWEFHYPDLNIVTANEVHMPVSRNVVFEMTSDDVIHSFWLPRIGGKRDVVPLHTNYIWFDAPRNPDVILGQCAEFCGTSHANMRAKGFVQSEADWNTWVQTQRTPSPAAAGSPGAQLFQSRGCIACHTISGLNAPADASSADLVNAKTGRIGPNLSHIGSRTTIAGGILPNTPEEMARWLRDPPAVKPGSLMPKLGLSEEDISGLVQYLESLR
jgi:cytochrome c oxidase subunit 2